MISRPARQRWFDRSRLAFAVDVTDRPTARVDPHTHPRKKPPRVPFAREARTRHRLARRRRHRTIIHRIHPVGRRARAHTKKNNSLNPIHTQTHAYPITTRIWPSRARPDAAAAIRARRAIKTRRVREITGYDSSIEAEEDTTRAFSKVAAVAADRRAVFESSIGRTTARTRANGGTSEKIK